MLAQTYSLDRVAADYPDLVPQVRRAIFEFNSTALGEGAEALDTALKEELGAEWPTTKAAIEEEFQGITKKIEDAKESAEKGIEEVRQRAKGNMPESIRNTLLANCPAYVQSPGAELAAGWRQDFSTLKHPKATGADITIALPLSWRKRESKKEQVVQVFRSGAGNGPILCSISCVKILDDAENEMPVDEMKKLFTDALIKEAIPEGATFIEGRPMTIVGKPGSMVVYDLTQEELDLTFKERATLFMIVHKRHLTFEIMGQFLKGMGRRGQ